MASFALTSNMVGVLRLWIALQRWRILAVSHAKQWKTLRHYQNWFFGSGLSCLCSSSIPCRLLDFEVGESNALAASLADWEHQRMSWWALSLSLRRNRLSFESGIERSASVAITTPIQKDVMILLSLRGSSSSSPTEKTRSQSDYAKMTTRDVILAVLRLLFRGCSSSKTLIHVSGIRITRRENIQSIKKAVESSVAVQRPDGFWSLVVW